MTQADPNTDDYSQFVGRMAQEMREALAPHMTEEIGLRQIWAKMGLVSPPLPISVTESISFAWGARSIHAKLLAPPKVRPAFVHCMGCLLPVTPSRSRFAFSGMAVTEEQMTDVCERYRAGVGFCKGEARA